MIFPNSIRINRGAYVIKDLINVCEKRELTDLILIHEHRGNPDGLIVSHMPFGPTIYFGLKDVVLRHDLKEKPEKMSEAAPHLIFEGFSSQLGERVTSIIKHLFPIPKAESKRVYTFALNNDVISFRYFFFISLILFVKLVAYNIKLLLIYLYM